jgi:hypothetical protein
MVYAYTLSRIMSSFQGKRLYNLFRGEFLAEYVATTGTPISSDAFTGFGKDKWTVHNKYPSPTHPIPTPPMA